jgi:hypothetical protein
VLPRDAWDVGRFARTRRAGLFHIASSALGWRFLTLLAGLILYIPRLVFLITGSRPSRSLNLRSHFPDHSEATPRARQHEECVPALKRTCDLPLTSTAVLQRVKSASVTVDGQLVSSIGRGLLVLAAVSKDDTAKDIESMASKVTKVKLWDDDSKNPPGRVSAYGTSNIANPY